MSDTHAEHSAEPHIVAEKVRLDEDGNIIEYTGETRYAGPADIELNVGDGPINGMKFLRDLSDDLRYRETVHARVNAMSNPLRAFVEQALEAARPESETIFREELNR